jgi:hypothetical protein
MRRYIPNFIYPLESRLSLTSMSVVGITAAPAVSVLLTQPRNFDVNGAFGIADAERVHDPLPNPEPAPGPDPGDNPVVEYPILPPSGPSGPGS